MPKEIQKKIHMRLIEKVTTLPYTSLFLLWIGMAVGFGFLYFKLSIWAPEHGPTGMEGLGTVERLLDSLYYSIITATSTGYGDITPQGLSKLLAAMQSIMALFVFAVFVTKLVSNRQEITLEQVHRLSFEDVVHNTREGMHQMRSDFDRAIQEAEETGSLSEERWTDILIAYKQGQSILQEIPDFYDDGNHLYTIDERREQLLQEGVHRTLHRINQLLDVLSAKGIDWTSDERSMEELRELIRIVNEATPLWKEESPYEQLHEAFEDILHINQKIHSSIQSTME